ncbi:Dynein gamma chain, flagellar outer arm [Symbiodinium microadriaticum]|uniref:Dynein gamma chain, flagellar outer arm n=1 Tax=Symbiodinium microadriaticum TaxID=2951 RepID=A0A1Q9D1J8_SYMMI|nr:Dynein gamma chain, flagellar outer arm [Symbiodinium microadriaticum]
MGPYAIYQLVIGAASTAKQSEAEALVKGLMVVGQVKESDTHFAHLFEAEHRRLADEAVKTFQLPEASQRCAASKEDAESMVRLAVSQDWDRLVPSMVRMLGKLTGRTVKAQWFEESVTKSPKQATPNTSRDEARMKLFQDSPSLDDEADSDSEEPEERESCCRCCSRCLLLLLAAVVGLWLSAWLLENCRRAGLLPVPALPQTDLVREHPEVIGEYGALLETWCRDIERYLEDGLDQHSAVQEPGPRSELDFWRGRMQKITSITEQLKGRECKSVFNVLHDVP